MPQYLSTKDFLKQQLANFKDATNRDKVLRKAVIAAATVIKNRIQQEGEKSDGSQIGKYGDKVIPQAFGKAKTFASKKRLKTVTKEDPYKILRQKLGLQTAYVDLTFSGDMIRDFKPGPTGPTSYGVGFFSEDQNNVAESNEKRYGPIFQQQQIEQNDTLQLINDEALKFLSK